MKVRFFFLLGFKLIDWSHEPGVIGKSGKSRSFGVAESHHSSAAASDEEEVGGGAGKNFFVFQLVGLRRESLENSGMSRTLGVNQGCPSSAASEEEAGGTTGKGAWTDK